MLEQRAGNAAAGEVEKLVATENPLRSFGKGGQKVELAVEMLESARALLVLSGGRPLSVLTRTDVLSYFTAIAEDALERGSGTVSSDG